MRIAVLIIGILIGLFFIFMGFISVVAETDDLQASGAYDQVAGTFWGVMILWALGIAFVLGLPLISSVLFLVAGIAGISAGFAAPDDAGVIGAWGLVSLVLAGMSLIGWRGKRKEQRTFKLERVRQEERDTRMEQLLRQQAQVQQASSQLPCPSCQRLNPPNVRFCGNCGAALVANA